MYILILWRNGWKGFKIFPILFETWEEAHEKQAELFKSGGGEKQGWFTIIKCGIWFNIGESVHAGNRSKYE